MNLITHCRYCGSDIVFLKTPKVFGNGDKAIPINPETINEFEWQRLVENKRVEVSSTRHSIHFNTCSVKAKSMPKLLFDRYHNSRVTA